MIRALACAWRGVARAGTGPGHLAEWRCAAGVSAVHVKHNDHAGACRPQQRAAKLTATPAKPFLPFKRWKDNVQATAANAVLRNVEVNVQQAVDLYAEYCATVQALEQARAQRNKLGLALKKLGGAKHGKDGAAVGEERLQELRTRSRQLKEDLATLGVQRDELEGLMIASGARIPNDTHPDVPAVEPVLQCEVGVKQTLPFCAASHVDIAETLDFVDFKAAAACSGRSFYFLKGAAAMLELALISYAMSFYQGRGYLPVTCPDLVRTHIAESCGFQPRDASSQMYLLDDRHSDGHGTLCLTGTAEIALAGLVSQTTFATADLPLKMVGFNHAFREEAGGAGAASRGLYRVHQFSKVELFAVTEGTLDASEPVLQEIVELQKEFFETLDLHFQVLDMPAVDLGAPAFRKVDIEAWMPGRDKYGEISSASNCTDFQSRRLNTRHKSGQSEESKFVHTLNGTAAAVPRLIVALLENGQMRDGRVALPGSLKGYMPAMDGVVFKT